MIDIKNLHFTYPGHAEEMIKGLNFTIGKGEIFGFLGPSGAGKSTTQKIIIGLLKDYQGEVKVNGQEVRKMKSDYYEQIGVVFEVPNFYNKLTALENLNFFRSLYTRASADPRTLLSWVGLESYGDTRVSKFSKGMKMRLNFCRAFLHG
jgi:fluoroquinolone transport system ATP-binding protein